MDYFGSYSKGLHLRCKGVLEHPSWNGKHGLSVADTQIQRITECVSNYSKQHFNGHFEPADGLVEELQLVKDINPFVGEDVSMEEACFDLIVAIAIRRNKKNGLVDENILKRRLEQKFFNWYYFGGGANDRTTISDSKSELKRLLGLKDDPAS